MHPPLAPGTRWQTFRRKLTHTPATCGGVGGLQDLRPASQSILEWPGRGDAPGAAPLGPAGAGFFWGCPRVLPLPSEHGHGMLMASRAWSPRATQWVGQGQDGSPWRAEHLLSSQGVHRGLSKPPAATGMSPGPHSTPLGRGSPTRTDSASGTRLVPVMCGGPVGGASVDRRQGLTHETDRERDVRPLERGFPMTTVAWVPPLSSGGSRPPSPLHPEPPLQSSTSACHTPALLTALPALHCSGETPCQQSSFWGLHS